MQQQRNSQVTENSYGRSLTITPRICPAQARNERLNQIHLTQEVTQLTPRELMRCCAAAALTAAGERLSSTPAGPAATPPPSPALHHPLPPKSVCDQGLMLTAMVHPGLIEARHICGECSKDAKGHVRVTRGSGRMGRYCSAEPGPVARVKAETREAC